tara:strand:+ start:67 stop:714 length:648 start_codon:yes stop_codon:yes gene_type:complete
MFFDQKKFVEKVTSLKASELNTDNCYYYNYARKVIENNFNPIFKECVSWESDEEKTKVFDYMRKYGVQDQIERDFSPQRHYIDNEIVFAPAYETWSASEALLTLMTYRNSAKLVQATIDEHRNFIKEVAGNLLPEESVAWVYKDSDDCARAIDRGYSVATFPVVAAGAAFCEYLAKLTKSTKQQEKAQEELNDKVKEVENLTALMTSTLTQLQSV